MEPQRKRLRQATIARFTKVPLQASAEQANVLQPPQILLVTCTLVDQRPCNIL